LLRCTTARVAVLNEFEARLWVKSDRPSVQLAARVALPRTTNPKNGAPSTVIVRGGIYNRPGHWQQLILTDVPRLLAAEVRIMRATAGAEIDPREAFVDSIVLVIPGDPQGVEVLTDDLEVDGIRLSKFEVVEQANYVDSTATAANVSNASQVRVESGLLLVNDRPFLPQAVVWQGEPLTFLAERGFNTVQLPGLPTDEQIADAQRLGLWFLPLAPRPENLAREAVGRSNDRILAWLLSDEAVEVDANYAVRWAELIGQRDAVSGRPLVIAPQADWSVACKSAEILAARHPRRTGVSRDGYQQWLTERRNFAPPGTPLWAIYPTQYDNVATDQVAALSGRTQPPPSVDFMELESLVGVACASEVRGFLFQSHSPLTESDVATRARAAQLELINRRLQLIEPWLAGGKVIGRLNSSDSAWSGFVLHVDRARLLVPMRASTMTGADERDKPSPSELVFLVPGVPESSQAYALSPTSMRLLPLDRVAGGTRLSLPATGQAFALITEDPRVLQSLRQRASREGGRFARLERELLALRAALLAENARRLAQLGYRNNLPARASASLDDSLRQLDGQLAGGHWEQACLIGASAESIFAQAVADQRRAVGASQAFESHPLALSYEQLDEYAEFQQTCAGLRGGDNLLYGGDFENLRQMIEFGWKHIRQPLPGRETHVELSAEGAKHGQFCLALHAPAAAVSKSTPGAERMTEWIVSSPVPVEAGQIMEITGWVRVDNKTDNEGDGLHIVDSLGGPELSLSVGQTSGWQPFRLVRVATKPTEVRLSFAHVGTGSAHVDAVMVRVLTSPSPHPLPPPGDTHEATDPNVADQQGPLLSAPQPR
jgi:hypothetical protein